MTGRFFARLAPEIVLLAAMLALLSPRPGAAAPLRVFAAASLKTALDQAAALYEQETGQAVKLSYGGSSAMARQISLGAPADVFLSANEAWLAWLAEQGLIRADSRRDLWRNRLVVASGPGAAQGAPIERLTDLPGALGTRRLAMAQTNAVPAGIYGKAALEGAGVWPALAPHLAQSENVRAALALVAAGAAPYGIVYQTDAQADSRVSVALLIPEDLHPPIVYPAAIVAGSDAEGSQD
ncbi:molybdate ABC transporter substrate-binding protein, partial [Phaeobacter sp. HF9A]|uniref:molybdate ABC transporter substrate-binding protein n=1 Tax=Phaeobacter sp. HF9A TaxID=2721561 RepID=UPI001431369E